MSPTNTAQMNGSARVRADTETPDTSDAEPQPARLPTAWTADRLMATTFPDPRWAVPGLLPEGVTLLTGPPKIGKSWLSLGVGLAVAAGTTALDTIDTTAGDVLYLALEDTPRRLQSRIGRILTDRPAPARLTLATACPPLPEGGTDAIAQWLDRNPGARLVVIDVFARIRGRATPGASAYDADYTAVTRAKHLADTYGVAVVLVHHVRKAASEDFLEAVSGTNGLAGAADTTMVLKRARGAADATLHITGRDVDEAEYALAFHPAAGAWRLLDGPPDEHALPDTRATILRHLRHTPGDRPKTIAEATGLGYDNIKRTCARMAIDGQLTADHTGGYHPPPKVPRTGGQPTDPTTVPPVPTVLQPPLTSETPRDNPVPAVPDAPLSEHAESEGTTRDDR